MNNTKISTGWTYSGMEHQAEIFQSCKEPGSTHHTIPDYVSDNNNNAGSAPAFHISITDQHIITIVSTYIQKIPDKDSKKQLARIMINFIMKSANI